MTTSIAIADDHQLFAQALSGMIQKFDGYEVMYTVENGRELIDQFEQEHIPDIVLLDLNMPEMDGFETAAYLQEHFPHVKILTLSMLDEEEHVEKMVRYGVRGYLLKGCKPAELRQALNDIRTKGHYYSDFLARNLFQSIRKPAQSTKAATSIQLNNREKDFLRLACSDMTYAEIADKMCVSVRTVDGYRESLFQKLNVKSRTGMVIEALRLKLIQL
jgi:two-component system, NarL family, invasion response regulator UvrY